MKLHYVWVVFLAITLGTACGSESKNNEGPGACTEITIDGTTYCAWEKEILVETGYECPSEFSFFHDFENVAVCSSEETPPGQEILTQIETELGIGELNNENNENNLNNSGCVTDSDCASGQACSIGACVVPCTTGADCASDEVCAPAIDGPVASLCTTATCDAIESFYEQTVTGFTGTCNDPSDCQVIDGHCGVGIGGCYYVIGMDDDASNLTSLSEAFSGQGCTSGVCDCAPPPSTDCVNNVCVAQEFVFSGDVNTSDASQPDWSAATINVRFEDVSIIDAPSVEISTTVIDGASAFPVPFSIYAPGGFTFAQGSTYNLYVHVDVDNDGTVTTGDWVTTQSYPVASYFDVINALVEVVVP